MSFNKEVEFEEALVKILSTDKGWERDVLYYPTEEDLIRNWANILFENNRGIDRLNDYPLTEGEMQQILEQIKSLRTPLNLNSFINGGYLTIRRDNPEDTLHYGKEVSLKIYDRREIAAGQSRYQIVRQPRFPAKSKILNDRRGDLMLLINGMPVIHIELKSSSVPVSEACYQIEKYSKENVFTGLFSLVQIFVAMTPEETVYFANPGPDGKFNPDFYFHWADVNNEPINEWKQIASTLLSIPMAHQLIGFYTVADAADGILKVMRSYQYYAASAIADRVSKNRWEDAIQHGGFVWHTTGSGKTMTSFKSSQLIASSRDADKVVFLMDRIELGTQTLRTFRNFKDVIPVQATENTKDLASKLKNDKDTLIVTSIQKMSNVCDEADGGLSPIDLEKIVSKRMVFIVDECHRSTFGDMLYDIKKTFPKALFFGFTGTPIHKENQKKFSTTASVFGDELHRYSISDGIRDHNVLPFDPYKVLTYKDSDLRQAVALEKSKAKDVKDANSDPKKKTLFYKYMALPMAGSTDANGNYIKGIEDYIPESQYERKEHQKLVVQDIKDNWEVLSRSGKFHAIFATSSIAEAIEYYRLIKDQIPELKVTALFDPNIDNCGNGLKKEEALEEIIQDYNDNYRQTFSMATFAGMKKDIGARLAHKDPYKRIEFSRDDQIDLLIVVDQMLTGYDSKWLNTLYLDKLLKYENIIQAFSRTNRLFNKKEKPFGTIRYYRRPHTMQRNIVEAVKLYSGDKPLALFVDRLDVNLEKINEHFKLIKELFNSAGKSDFSELPKGTSEKKKFAKLLIQFNRYLEAAKIQGFRWGKSSYEFVDPETNEKKVIDVCLDEKTYLTLVLRYKEMISVGVGHNEEIPYEIDGYLTTIETDDIDSDYLNSRFKKYLKVLYEEGSTQEMIKSAEDELHRTFATLSQEDQKFADIFLHDIQRGEAAIQEGKTLREYITEYKVKTQSGRIHKFAETLGIDEEKLREMMNSKVTEANINEYGRLDALKKTANKQKAKAYFEKQENTKISPPKVSIKLDNLLRDFILKDGIDI